jgi:hypothetical protein
MTRVFRHSRRHARHGPVARVRARVAGWLDRAGRRYEWDDAPFTGFDCAEGVHGGECERGCECDCHEDVSRPGDDGAPDRGNGSDAGPGHPERLPDAGERAGMFGELAPERLDAENVPGSRAQAAEQSGSTLNAGHGPGYFHDDAPPEVVPAVQLADGSYAGLRGTIRGPLYGAKRWPMPPAADSPTAVDVGQQPRHGPPAWRPQRPALPAWVTDILGAPSVDAWAWGWQQKRRLAIT